MSRDHEIQTLAKVAEQAVLQMAGELREEAIQQAVAQFEKDLRARIAPIAINVSNYYSVHVHRDSLVVTIDLNGYTKR